MSTRNPLLLGAALLGFAACSSGLSTGGAGVSPGDPSAARATGLGLDLGLTLAERIEDGYSIAGATIPGITEEDDRRIAFVAFSTRSAASDGDGLGTPLVRDAVAPNDTNGEEDVFIVALEDDLIDMGEMGAHPAAFSRALVNTFRHDRCVHCHALGSAAEAGEELAFPGAPHPGGAEPVMTDTCNTCHSPANVPDLAGIEWRAPRDANGDFDFRGNTLEELAMKAMSVPLDEHLLNDGRIRWAIESGNVPFVAPRVGGNAGASPIWEGFGRDVGAVPISFALFRAQAQAWRDGGFQVTARNSVRDVILVSEARSGGSAANGRSRRPVLTWIPNPAYDPANPTAQAAGNLVVAFESTATNLVVGGNTRSDVYRSSLSVSVDVDPSNGAPLPGGLDVDLDPADAELVSVNSAGTAPANASSAGAAIDATGDHVVFTSEATDLTAGFTDGNGAGTDVFHRNMASTSTELISTNASGTSSGDGPSSEVTISPTGLAFAFSSTATDLIADDTNGQQDVFYAQLIGGTLTPIARASVGAQGNEGTGGASYDPAIVVGPAGTLSVAFTSDVQDLAPVAALSNVFLHENGTTTLLSQRKLGGISEPGNAPSVAPALSPTGDSVVFETLASNLDVSQPADRNGESDVVLVDLRGFRTTGSVAARRISVDSMGQDAEGPSAGARIATFRDSIGSFSTSSFALFRSGSENLGFTNQDLITNFLNDADTVVRTDFSADTVAGPPTLTVTFSDASNGAPSAWAWDFGDGATSTEQNPTHSYGSVGEYDVSLTVTREAGTDTVIKAGYVRVLEPLEIVGFTASDTVGPAPLTTSFAATLSGNQEEISYLWDFGDGSGSTEASPLHTYFAPGVYDVSLTVSGLAGDDVATESDYITVNAASGANFSFVRNGLETEFDDTSTGSPTSWFWQFGDGSTSTFENPTHRYADNGTFSVTLSIDGPGGPSQITKTVTTNARPFQDVYARFSSNGCNGCHTGGSPSGGLLINAARNTVYNELVNVLAEGGDCANGTLRRVRPYDSAASLLLQTVTPNPAPCNAGNGMASWSSADRSVLSDWINDGAARN